MVAEDVAPSRYREVAPPCALATHVVCTWSQEIGPAPHVQSVLPDGCVDLIWIGDEAPFVVGPMTRMDVTPLPAGATAVGVRLAPGRASEILGIAASELVDVEAPVADVIGALAAPIDPALPVDVRRRLVEERMVARAAPRYAADPVVVGAVAWLARHPAGRVQSIAARAGVSDRQLQRRFVRAVGYGPKVFQRIARFQYLLALAARGGADLATLAVAAGYADQAHMTREVRALSGRTPGALLGAAGSALAMSDLFKTAAELAA